MLASIAMRLLVTIATMDRGASSEGPAGYRTLVVGVDGSWLELQEGTKDRCVGFAECRGGDAVVVCGGMIVWPEDRWGDTPGEPGTCEA
jgi:hypothetical protein